MKLSVCCISYNHGKFIAKALDGFLSQKTNFDFNIVIADDCSTDDTAAVLQDYSEKYPGKITLIINDKNIGMMANLAKAYNACTAPYIAFCEGDDYWTDPLKLQKQVDFLEANPDFVQVFHNAMVITTDASREPYLLCTQDQGELCETKDLLQIGNIIPTCSNVFRRSIMKEIPDWVSSLAMADWPVNIVLSQKGKVKYLNEVMAVYRIHAGGVWSATTAVKKCIMMRDAYQAYLANLTLAPTEIIICKKMVAKWNNNIYNTLLANNNKKKAAIFLLTYVCKHPLYVFNIRFLKNVKHLITTK